MAQSVRTAVAPADAASGGTGASYDRAVNRLAMRGSAIQLGGYVANQVLRLGTNLVLARLLFPEAYGLAAIVTVFLIALTMFTDVGIRQAVVYSDRGDDVRFLNTVWTIQVIRGFGLWLVATLLAYPVSLFYGEPVLFPLLAAGAAANIVHGFGSTAVLTLERRVHQGFIVARDLGAKVVAMIVMFVWAWFSPSVWVLIVGGLVQSFMDVLIGHLLPVGYRNWFAWDRDAVKAVRTYGKWIFGSSIFKFLASEADRLLISRLASMAVLGVYSVAWLLASAVGTAVEQLAHNVFFGVFSKVARESRDRLVKHYYAARLKLDLLAMPALGALMVLGPVVVSVLYDERYHEAGWMLQLLCVKIALSCAVVPCGVCLMAIGQPKRQMYANVARFFAVWTGLPLGWLLGGIEGLVWAAAASEVPVLLLFWWALGRERILRIRRELFAPVAAAAGAGVGLLIQSGIDRFFPGLVSG